ncbi:alpha/beta hydrolase [uncultured Tateyamaria sp.]|uniref:alpha/beta fold hydrolase n=1 Tax=uncultured Tateyamaria sp. TaxID=455651 RepID=UPI00262C71CD|nr:alpha/beta hydrolase [uncultured Tateyamaria sp.]
MKHTLTAAGLALASLMTSPAFAGDVQVGYETVDGVKIFYREAGNPENPAIVLLHGFPSSSHQYRHLLDELSDDYYLIAPDYPGFGASDFPSPDSYTYTFDNIAETVDTFLEQKGIDTFSMYLQDYGAPVGFRIATVHPERIETLIIQNGNAYEEGVNPETWAPVTYLWENGRDAEYEQTLIPNIFSVEGLRWQYTHGTRNPDGILPDNWLLDHQAMSRPGMHDVQLGLIYDYRNNVAKYPEWQAYMREHQPPALIVWAKNDAYFPVAGAEGYQRDLVDVDYNILDTGHFALEEDGDVIALRIRNFLSKRLSQADRN